MAAHENSRQTNDDLIISLFQAAMSRPDEEREQFLREACSEDAALVQEVQRRVKWETRLNGFLLTPVVPRDRMDRPFSPGERVLGRFQILRVAGEGGMGVVYEVLDEKLGHRIALKCPRFEFRRRLSPEAVNSLRVTHANVCRVFEIHTAETNSGDVDFLTMEFLEGETLAARLPTAPERWLATVEGAELARQICSGLNAVHAQGVIHRDLKAGNVMLSSDAAGRPRAVIMDFGIAQGGDVFSSQTRGTPDYLAPEIWKGQAASPQSDIYALGVLLYEMACGRKPFAEATSWKERLQSLPQVSGIHEPARSAILRCVNPDPKRRFQSALEVERALAGGSRRWLLGGLIGVAATGIATTFAKQTFWPSSAVRLAILPPAVENAGADASLIQGFLHDVSYRLKTLRGTRRPLAVYSPAQTGSESVKTAAAARTVFSATHAISSAFRSHGGGWLITAELLDASGNRTLRRLDRASAPAELAALLFSFQSDVVRMATEQLALRAEPRMQTLNRESYADYLKGLYFARVDYEKAVQGIPYFERVIAAAPESALGYAGLAEALLGARNTSGDKSLEGKALTALAKAEQLDPDLAPVHLMAGRLNLAAGWYERAVADLRRAAELDPNDAQAFISMGYALYCSTGLRKPKRRFGRRSQPNPATTSRIWTPACFTMSCEISRWPNGIG